MPENDTEKNDNKNVVVVPAAWNEQQWINGLFESVKKYSWMQTRNGVRYHEELAGPDGMSFILFRENHHTNDDIAAAKRQLRQDRDVVRLSVKRVSE